MKAVFTIVAKNYIPLAITLMKSIKAYHPDFVFHIFLADEIENDELPQVDCKIIGAREIGIPNYEELAMKYNVTEFCTAVKPFAFSHLFAQGQFEGIIYFDPDIVVFNRLDSIVEGLNQKNIVLTPHFITPEINYSGTVPEGGILFLGMFNLGFIGLTYSDKTTLFLDWWKNRLQDKCYADKIDGYHTDQKWIDFAMILFNDDIKIVKDLGANMAFWNLHERKLVKEGDYWNVVNRITGQEVTTLKFFHFAGYDMNDTNIIHKYHSVFTISDFPDISEIMANYRILLKNNGFGKIKGSYSYSIFKSGEPIVQFQRRLFRRLVEEGLSFKDPFDTGPESFYNLLKKSNLLTKNPEGLDKFNQKNIGSFESKLTMLNRGMLLLKQLIGFDRYALLLKFSLRYVRPENQTFLIKGLNRKIEFFHEGAFKKKQK